MRFSLFMVVGMVGMLAIQGCSRQEDDMSDAACVPAGCNGELCVAADEASGITTSCAYKPEYVCYATQGKCEVQSSGKCGWTQTPSLLRCLKNPKAFMEK